MTCGLLGIAMTVVVIYVRYERSSLFTVTRKYPPFCIFITFHFSIINAGSNLCINVFLYFFISLFLFV